MRESARNRRPHGHLGIFAAAPDAPLPCQLLAAPVLRRVNTGKPSCNSCRCRLESFDRQPQVTQDLLDDVDWRAGEITVRGKDRLHDRLPLLADVGEAVATYVR